MQSFRLIQLAFLITTFGATAEASETELLVMGGYHTTLRAGADDGPNDISYVGYSARAVLTSSQLALDYKWIGRLGLYYDSSLFDRPSYDDDPLVPDAILAKTIGVEWVAGVFDFPVQVDAAIGTTSARVNLGAVDKEVPYQGGNLRFGGQLTFGDHLVYFLRVERTAYRIVPRDKRKDGESLQPGMEWQSTPVLIGVGYRN